MEKSKKQIRETFRNQVFKRDENKCRKCGSKSPLDAHHILNRNLVPDGGYLLENGISLCDICHKKAEKFYEEGQTDIGYDPDSLFITIDSSLEKVFNKALQNKDETQMILYIGNALSYLDKRKELLNKQELNKLNKVKQSYKEITD